MCNILHDDVFSCVAKQFYREIAQTGEDCPLYDQGSIRE